MATGTTNPPGSDDPRDLRANAENLDLLITGPALNYPDRLGVSRRSWAGLDASYDEAEAQRDASFQEQLANTGYELPSIPYAAGILVERETQLIERVGEFYRAKPGVVPFTTTGTWATDELNLAAVGDAALRTELASTTGAALVSHRGRTVGELLDDLPPGGQSVQGNSNESGASLFFYAQTLQGPGGASIGVQSFAFNERTRNVYTLQLNGAGSGNMSTVNRFPLDAPIANNSAGRSNPVSTDVGHQGLAMEYLDGTDFRLWSTGYASPRQAVRYSYADSGPLANIELFTLFGADFEPNTSCTPTISYGQEFLIAYGTKTAAATTTVRVWKLADLVAGGAGDYSSDFLYEWDTIGLVDATHPTQGIASDGNAVWLLSGDNDINASKRLHMYSLSSGMLRAADNDFKVGRTQALADGAGTVYEPEGLCLYRSGSSLILCVGVISGDLGTRFSRVYAISTGDSAHFSTVFIDGNTRGAMSSTTDPGRQFLSLRASFNLGAGSGVNWYGNSDSANPGGITEFTNAVSRRTVDLAGTTNLKADSGLPSLQLDNAASGQLLQLHRAGVQYGSFDVSTVDISYNALNGAGIRFGTAGVGVFAGVARWRLDNAGHWLPFADNSYDKGSATLNIRTVYTKNIVLKPAASVTPANNGEVTFQLTSNTTLAVRVRGSDGVVRTGTITLS